MGHACGPACRHFVSLLHHMVDLDFEIGKRTAELGGKSPELVAPNNSVMLGLAMTDDAGRRHLVNRFHPSVVPHFLKPAANQSAIFLRHTAPPRPN